MIIINFAHPLTAAQRVQIETMRGQPIERIIEVPVQVDNQQPLAPQVADLVSQVDLPSTMWQTVPILLNPPGYAPVAAALIAEIHGRTGHFPAIIRIRPKHTAPEPYEVAEIINLQQVRDQSRGKR